MENEDEALKGCWFKLPIRVFSKVKPSTFHILTVWSDDAVARYLEQNI